MTTADQSYSPEQLDGLALESDGLADQALTTVAFRRKQARAYRALAQRARKGQTITYIDVYREILKEGERSVRPADLPDPRV